MRFKNDHADLIDEQRPDRLQASNRAELWGQLLVSLQILLQ